MRVQTLASFFIVVAILFIVAVASEVFIDGLMKPSSLFGYLVISTMITGVFASVIIQNIDTKILG